ncbi:MAG: hypothetical protein COW30_12165 [Rhodospirillales bacterium CG15_BIG_FIL_POST_REV_8_21_14_020_66_15]|nr:MAG: hypothetical protein COW30_12165 [Rhodospirillales bacterium CG15_BIG_FIL_POST_REV_8_21_14_020_66_15]
MSLSSVKKTAAFVGFMSLAPFATAVSAQEIASLPACEQAITDTLKTKDENPAVAEQTEAVFDQLIEQARNECAANSFHDAAATLNQARSLVAAE